MDESRLPIFKEQDDVNFPLERGGGVPQSGPYPCKPVKAVMTGKTSLPTVLLVDFYLLVALARM